jgi:hypothetical protein
MGKVFPGNGTGLVRSHGQAYADYRKQGGTLLPRLTHRSR